MLKRIGDREWNSFTADLALSQMTHMIRSSGEVNVGFVYTSATSGGSGVEGLPQNFVCPAHS